MSRTRSAVAMCCMAATATLAFAPPVQAQGARAVPTVVGPVSGTSAADHPFNAAAYQIVPIDLATVGYREDEYFLSGRANVYQYANVADPTDNAVEVLRSGPYTNRILVRRPVDPKQFSGNVVIEILNATNNYDLPIYWSYAHDYFTSRGDVWIGITGKPVAIAGLKKFNPARYASLSWANPNPNETDATCPTLYSIVGGASHATEDGLLYDALSQTASLIRSPNPSNPLHGYAVREVYAAGYSQSAIALVGYVNAITLGISGSPIFDGYLVGSGFGIQAPLNQCSPQPAAFDARNVLRSKNAAIIATQSQSDYASARQAYRPDSDAPEDRYRYFEAAGPSHVVVQQTTSAPNATDTHAAGGTTLLEDYTTCQAGAELNNFPGADLLDASIALMNGWVREDKLPPHAPLLAATGTAPNLIETLDAYGNAVGGVRAPEVDVPVATYTSATGMSSLNCSLSGQVIPFQSTQLKTLYPTTDEYLLQVVNDTLSVARRGFLTPDDTIKTIINAYDRKVP